VPSTQVSDDVVLHLVGTAQNHVERENQSAYCQTQQSSVCERTLHGAAVDAGGAGKASELQLCCRGQCCSPRTVPLAWNVRDEVM
jgi:hypothetical protein